MQTGARSLIWRATRLQATSRRRRLSSLLNAMLIDKYVLLSVHTEQAGETFERNDPQPGWDRTTLVTMMEIEHEYCQHH